MCGEHYRNVQSVLISSTRDIGKCLYTVQCYAITLCIIGTLLLILEWDCIGNKVNREPLSLIAWAWLATERVPIQHRSRDVYRH